MGDTTRTSLHTLVVDHHKNEVENFSFFLITLTLFLTPTIFRHTCSFLFFAACVCLLVTTTSAVHTSAGGAALAVTFSLSSLNVHDNNGADKAQVSLDEVSSIAASLLHTLAPVSAVAVAAGVRHVD